MQVAEAKPEKPERVMPEWIAAAARERSTPAVTLRRSAEVGYAAVMTPGRSVASSFGARFRFDVDRIAFAESLEYVTGPGTSRLVGLLGVGPVLEVHRRARAFALAVGGFDAWTSQPVLLSPAVGARVGVEWDNQLLFRNTMSVSVLGLTALGERKDSTGTAIGATTIGVSASVGFNLGPSSR